VGEWRVGLWTLVMRAKRRDLFLLVMFLSDGAGVGLGVRLALVRVMGRLGGRVGLGCVLALGSVNVYV